MRYGVRDDYFHSSKKSWKTLVENDIAELKAEVLYLKQQLKSSVDLTYLLFNKLNEASVRAGLVDITGSGYVNYSPTEGLYDRVANRTERFNCISVHQPYQGKSQEELRLEDYILKQINIHNQYDPVKNTHIQESPSNAVSERQFRKIKISERPNSSERQEELLTKLVSQLEKVDTNVTSVKTKLSSMDINLSEMKSQMSVMDSRLSAVDMFVTMQQVDKSWKGLTPRLRTLEILPDSPKNEKTKSELSLSTIKQDLETPTLNNISQNKCPSPENTILVDLIENNILVDSGKKFKSQTKTKSTNKRLSDLSLETLFADETDTILISESATSVGTGLSDNIQKIDTLNCKSDMTDKLEILGNKSLVSSDYLSPTLSDNVKAIESDSPINNTNQASVNRLNSSLLTQSMNNEEENESNQKECDFVLVNKSDVDELCDRSSNNSFTGINVSSDYKLCHDITEYLEVNLGKRKDTIYEFGFEAKPDESLLLYINGLQDSNTQQSTPLSSGEKCKPSESKHVLK